MEKGAVLNIDTGLVVGNERRMPRKLRVEYPGAIYHVMNRGDRREPIFKDDEDRKLFLATLGECCGKTDWQVHAWCLMLNHFHLVVETPRANLVAGMKWFLGSGWACPVGSPNGATAGSRRQAGLPGDPTGLVFWRGVVPQGAALANG